jgi:hypothetical protein
MPQIISRRDAHAKGLKRFFTGQLCQRGHLAERYTSNGCCVECQVYNTPNKSQGAARASNAGWPPRALVFGTFEPPLHREEIEAAFLLIERYRWHDAALAEIRKNPALLVELVPPPAPEEQMRLAVELERAQRLNAAKSAGVPAVAASTAPLVSRNLYTDGEKLDRSE